MHVRTAYQPRPVGRRAPGPSTTRRRPSRCATCAGATATSRPSAASRSRCTPAHVALFGVNGAGKTSALELVEGLAAPAGGTVRILGRDPRRDRAAVRRHLGVLLQSSGLPGDLTVRETVASWAGTLSTPRDVDEALGELDLGTKADVRVRSLSGGERRRLDVVLALLGRPRVVVLDEPTTGLDPESRRTVWAVLRGLVESGAAVVLTTHYLEEAEELADRIAVLRDGRIVLAGTQGEIAETQPATIRFTLPDGAPPPPTLPGVRVVSPAPGGRDPHPRPPGGSCRAARLGVGARSPAGRTPGPIRVLEQAFLAVADGTDVDPPARRAA